MRFLVYDRWGNMVAEAPVVYNAEWTARINNEDTLKIDVPYVLAKGDRIVWELNGIVHEHVVNEITQEHEGGQSVSYVCDHSAQWDLRLAHIRYANWRNVTAQYALTELLKLTSWEVGEVQAQASSTASFEFSKMSAYDALLEVVGAFDLEVEPRLTVDKRGITSRSIALLEARGSPKKIRFDYGYGLDGVTKEVLADDVITACYGYGKSGSGKNSSLTFANINNGSPYIVDDEALQYWGLPDGHGGLMHSFGYYENTDCTNAQQLLNETRAYLEEHSKPAIAYQTSMPFASIQGVDIGDTIDVVDTDFNPPIRMKARIGALDVDLLTGITNSSEFGASQSVVPDIYARVYHQSSTAYNAAAIANQAITDMETAISTVTITLGDGDDTGVLTVKDGALYYNDERIGG